MRCSVRASAAKSLPVRPRTSAITASIIGVGTPHAAPSARIGIRPTGTSSVMYLWSKDFGVPVAWYGPSLLVVSSWQVSDSVAPRTP